MCQVHLLATSASFNCDLALGVSSVGRVPQAAILLVIPERDDRSRFNREGRGGRVGGGSPQEVSVESLWTPIFGKGSQGRMKAEEGFMSHIHTRVSIGSPNS